MKTTVIHSIKEKLSLINEQFLDKQTLEKILSLSASTYTIANLVKKKYILPIKRNTVYINTLYGKIASPEAVIGLYLKGSAYMLGGMSVYNMYEYSTQMAQRHTVYNTKIYGKKIIGNHRYIFKKKRSSFFWGRQLRKKQGITYYVMTKERALIEMVLENKGILEFEQDIRKQLTSGKIDTTLLKNLGEKHLSKNNLQILHTFIQRGLRN